MLYCILHCSSDHRGEREESLMGASVHFQQMDVAGDDCTHHFKIFCSPLSVFSYCQSTMRMSLVSQEFKVANPVQPCITPSCLLPFHRAQSIGWLIAPCPYLENISSIFIHLKIMKLFYSFMQILGFTRVAEKFYARC